MTQNVYITDLASFFPNKPVKNEEMEDILGMIGGKPSRSRGIVLRNNGIKTRYYAIDPATGRYTHNNAQMVAEAVRALSGRSGVALDGIECLCCGTSTPDQIKPGIGQMVHGELGSRPTEVISTAGVCCSGMSAMKYAYMNVAAGLSANAVSTGSEFSSSFMRGAYFEPEIDARVDDLENNPSLAFEKDFLRWMLSDGAGAAMIKGEPNDGRLSLRIDWIENVSFAGQLPVCMYSGAVKDEDGTLRGWREAQDPRDVLRHSYFAFKQDARILEAHIIPVSVDGALLPAAAKHGLKPEQVTWFLPHYSSEYFKGKLYGRMAEKGFDVPYERWFTNLTSKGNTGAASIYVILEELSYSGVLKKGDRLLCYIPESARFAISYMHLTAV